jgi:hypothetical protein
MPAETFDKRSEGLGRYPAASIIRMETNASFNEQGFSPSPLK